MKFSSKSIEIATWQHCGITQCCQVSLWIRKSRNHTSSLQSTRVAYLDQSSNPVCGFSMTEQIRLCAVCPIENLLGTSKTTYRVGWMIWICYSRALERRCLAKGFISTQRNCESPSTCSKSMHCRSCCIFVKWIRLGICQFFLEPETAAFLVAHCM